VRSMRGEWGLGAHAKGRAGSRRPERGAETCGVCGNSRVVLGRLLASPAPMMGACRVVLGRLLASPAPMMGACRPLKLQAPPHVRGVRGEKCKWESCACVRARVRMCVQSCGVYRLERANPQAADVV